MIVIRNIFHLHFGKAREATPLLKQMAALVPQGQSRILADVTGEFYTLVLEETMESLSAAETDAREAMDSEAWKQLYAQFTPLVHSGRREVFRVVE